MLTGRDVGPAASATSRASSPAGATPATSCSRCRSRAQQAAADALGGQRGAVVVIDPKTGEIVAMFSNPTYDPNLMASHDQAVVQATFDAINSGNQAGVGAHLQRDLPSGIVVQDHHQRGRARHRARDTASRPSIPFVRVDPAARYHGPPLQLRRRDLRRQPHREPRALVQHDVRPDRPRSRRRVRARDQQLRCRRRRAPPLDLPGAVGSTGPAAGSFDANKAFFAKDAIGQQDVAVTPLRDGARGRGHRQRRRDHGARTWCTRSRTPTARR